MPSTSVRTALLAACDAVDLSYSDVAEAAAALEDRVTRTGDYSADVSSMLDRHAFEAVRSAAKRLEQARAKFELVKEDAFYELAVVTEWEVEVWEKALSIATTYGATEDCRAAFEAKLADARKRVAAGGVE